MIYYGFWIIQKIGSERETSDMNRPDIVEFAEKYCGVKLLECQKELLRKIEQLPPGERIAVLPHKRQLYFDGCKALMKEKEMDVKICDRCGKELMPINVFDKSLRGYLFRKGRCSYKAVRVENGDDFTFRHRKNIELCPSCYHELKQAYVLYDDADKRDANLLEAYRLLTNCLCVNTDGYSCDLNQESVKSALNDVIVLLAKALEE